MRGMYELWKRAAMNKEQGIHNWKRFPFQSTNSVLLLVANVRTIFSDKGMVYYHDLAMRTEHRNGDCGEISNGEYIHIYPWADHRPQAERKSETERTTTTTAMVLVSVERCVLFIDLCKSARKEMVSWVCGLVDFRELFCGVHYELLLHTQLTR